MKIFVEDIQSGVSPEVLNTVIAAINTQIKRDFSWRWGLDATLVLRGAGPEPYSIPDGATDAVLYLQKTLDVQDALGYHTINNKDVPYGLVSTQLSAQVGEDWSVTLSHETLELMLDPISNATAKGPHPKDGHLVFHWYEACDAVQAESYLIHVNYWDNTVKDKGYPPFGNTILDVAVSNFLTPRYFVPNGHTTGSTNFMNHALPSFGVRPGGYIGFYDPKTGKDNQYMPMHDRKAKDRWRIRSKLGTMRRAGKQERFSSPRQFIP